jgi:hypothetical protein
MVAPLVVAGAAAVARFIASKGMAAAIKRYGKQLAQQGAKHAKDMTTKPKAGQRQVEQATRGQRASRKAQRIGFGVGVAGAGLTGAAKIADMRKKLKAETDAKKRAQLQARIEKEVAKANAAKTKDAAKIPNKRPPKKPAEAGSMRPPRKPK